MEFPVGTTFVPLPKLLSQNSHYCSKGCFHLSPLRARLNSFHVAV